VKVAVAGQVVHLSTLERVLWPAVGKTKADLVRYVDAMSPVLLPALADHPVTLHRFPNGVGGPHFFQTRAPSHPPWVTAVTLRTPKAGKVFYVVVLDQPAALVWAANLTAIEFHPYLGTADDFTRPTALVFDLDPGPPADLVACCDLALVLRGMLDELGLQAWPKVSGGKGLHLHVPATEMDFATTKEFARSVATTLAHRFPERVVTTMARAERAGRVFIDWSQNDAWKSIIAPYSPRGLTFPTVAAPVTWEEVERTAASGRVRDLVFLMDDMPARLDRVGDLWAGFGASGW